MKNIITTGILIIALIFTCFQYSKAVESNITKADVRYVQCTIVKDSIKSCTDITDGKLLDTDWTKWKN